MSEYDMSLTPKAIRKVAFSPDVQLADCLLSDDRRGRLFDTLRHRADRDCDEQKLVDTALTCDLLHVTRTKEYSLLIVVSDDDDMLPGAITATAWKARVLVARQRPDHNPHLDSSLIRQL
jgi:hypothetical protein